LIDVTVKPSSRVVTPSPEEQRMPTSPLDLRRVDLNLLVAFDALMAEGSVTGAAHRLSVGQSSMSSTLARLRKLLDDPVMIREGRKMVITPVAEALIQPVRDTLDEIQALLSSRSRFDPAHDHRTLTVMTSDYAAIGVLHPMLAQLPTEAPNIQLRIQPAQKSFVEALDRNTIDLLIAPREVFPDADRYCHEPLYEDRYVVAVDANNPDVGDTLSLEQFSTMPYMATHYELLPSLAEIQLDLLGISRRVEVTASFGLAPFLLRNTRLVTLMPAVLGSRIAEAAGLRLVDPPMPLGTYTDTMVWTKRLDDDPAHQWLRGRLHQLAEELITPT
jgi:DNA-binding transcriptional LysR family regulator